MEQILMVVIIYSEINRSGALRGLNKQSTTNTELYKNLKKRDIGVDIICKTKDPKCNVCKIKKMSAYYSSESKTRFKRKIKIESKNYDIFCYLKKNT